MVIAARITTKVAWIGCALNVGAWLALHLPWQLGWTPHFEIAEWAVRLMFLSSAYLLAFLLNLEIAAEYRQVRLLRVAWLALAANAGFSVVRIVIESSLLNLVWERYKPGPVFGLLQHLAIVPANTCLLLGLLAMGWAYHRTGLGFRIEKRDYAAIAGVLGLIIALIYFRAGLSQAQSPNTIGRGLQLIGLVLLSLSAAASFVLHRQALQMGGGKLALALRWLTFYTLLRGVLVLAQAGYRTTLLDGQASTELQSLLFEPWWLMVPWLALLAAAHRSELTIHAARQLAQQRAARAAMASA